MYQLLESELTTQAPPSAGVVQGTLVRAGAISEAFSLKTITFALAGSLALASRSRLDLAVTRAGLAAVKP